MKAERIVGNKKLHEAAKDNLLAAYRVWCHRNPKRFPDLRVRKSVPVDSKCRMHTALALLEGRQNV